MGPRSAVLVVVGACGFRDMRVLAIVALAACNFAGQTAPTVGEAGTGVDAVPFDLESCPNEYLTVNGAPSRYRIAAASAFRSAHSDCKDDSASFTHLAVLDTVAEANALRAAVANAELWTGTVQEQDQATATVGWHVITGGDVVPMLWAANQPNESGNAENNEQNVAKLTTSGLDDDTYTDSKRVICECDGISVDPTVEAYIQP